MAANTSTLSPAIPNRRRRVRHRIQTPAYASFTSESKSAMLDLHEILDISEDGMAVQCHAPVEVQKQIHLCLDLADCADHIYTIGQVVWSNSSGRTGVRFSDLSSDALARLREWLFVNVMAGVANSETEIAAVAEAQAAAPPTPSYTDTLAAVAAVRRQVEALGSDLTAALQMIAARAQSFLRASGVAIALAESDPNFMVCRSTSGPDAPPADSRLQVGSGFSGECVKNGTVLRCDDSDLDVRVDREICRALGIRAILAAPVRSGDRSIGIIEAFSPNANEFSEADGNILRRLAEIVRDAANRSGSANLKASEPIPTPAPGSVLFAATDAESKKASDDKTIAGINLPRTHLILLLGAAATVAMALGWGLAPWIQSEMVPWIQRRIHAPAAAEIPTVLASSNAPKSVTVSSTASKDPVIETATFDQLRQMAQKGNAAAENAIGLRYATAEGVKLNEAEAVRWFTRAADDGSVPAQSKLGSIYFSGRGVPADPNRAYFWMVLARAAGDDASKTLAPFVRARLTPAQVTAIELQANVWLQQHQLKFKPAPGQLKASSKP